MVAGKLLERVRAGERGIAILNAKKETAYMFADALLALHEVAPDADISYIANLEERGPPESTKGRRTYQGCLLKGPGSRELVGALDEYGANGDALGKRLLEESPDFALIVGVPHAIPPECTKDICCFSITNGPRQVAPLKEIGHQFVVVEIDLHPKTLGVRDVIESEFGAVLRSIA